MYSISMQISRGGTTGLLWWHRPSYRVVGGGCLFSVSPGQEGEGLTSNKLLPWIWRCFMSEWLLSSVVLSWGSCISMDAWLCTLLSTCHQISCSLVHISSICRGTLERQSLFSPPSNSLLPVTFAFRFLHWILQSEHGKAFARAKLLFQLKEISSVVSLVQGPCLTLEEPPAVTVTCDVPTGSKLHVDSSTERVISVGSVHRC